MTLLPANARSPAVASEPSHHGEKTYCIWLILLEKCWGRAVIMKQLTAVRAAVCHITNIERSSMHRRVKSI